MDPEQTFLRVHARLSGMLSQLLTPRIRLAVEYMYLAVAVALFCLLVVMHTNFVQQPGCSSELSGIEFAEAQLLQIKIVSGGLWAENVGAETIVDLNKQESSVESDKIPKLKENAFATLTARFWSNWIGSSARRSKLISRSWKGDKDFLESRLESASDTSIINTVSDETDEKRSTEGHVGHLISAKESFKAAVVYCFSKWHMCFISLWKNAKQFSGKADLLLNSGRWNDFLDISKYSQMLRLEHVNRLIVQWLEKRSKAFEPTYLYTVEKGYYLLSEKAKSQHNIRTVNFTISAENSCFGNRWQQLLINSFVGYDTILTNSLLNSPGQGYLYNFQTKEFYDLSHGHEPAAGPARFGDYFVTKCGVLMMSLFVFFTTTMSVSFTLRETQSRMLKFTVHLQHHARYRLPTFRLIFVHVIESLVFVPIMIGILFFLFEFYDDQLLAFMVLTLVWLCELFTMISVRTYISMRFFPRFFLLYFLVFHIYLFSYAHGFSYLAFFATAAFMQHLILYFWNRFEVPALQRFMRSQGQLQQQARVQITSSTFYTSTLHIARVNVTNTTAVNNEHETGSEFHSGPNNAGSDHPRPADPALAETIGLQEPSLGGNLDPVGNALQFPDPSPRQTAPGSGSLNPFSSFLLWLLGGGGSPEGTISLFSMFRVVRDQDQGQVYAETSEHQNEPIT